MIERWVGGHIEDCKQHASVEWQKREVIQRATFLPKSNLKFLLHNQSQTTTGTTKNFFKWIESIPCKGNPLKYRVQGVNTWDATINQSPKIFVWTYTSGFLVAHTETRNGLVDNYICNYAHEIEYCNSKKIYFLV